jgi:hypothetical protein
MYAQILGWLIFFALCWFVTKFSERAYAYFNPATTDFSERAYAYFNPAEAAATERAAEPAPLAEPAAPADLLAKITRLKEVIRLVKLERDGLRAENERLKATLAQRPTMTAAELRNLQFCLHPDRVAFAKDAALTARYTQAFRWLSESGACY